MHKKRKRVDPIPPTLEEIAERAAAIREEWSDHEYTKRMIVPPLVEVGVCRSWISGRRGNTDHWVFDGDDRIR